MDDSARPGAGAPPGEIPLLEGLATTRAIRRFRPDRVTDDELQRVLFAATRAPSGSNRQPARFVVLRDGEPAGAAKAALAGAAARVWTMKVTGDGYDRGSGTRADSPKSRLARTMQGFVDNFAETPVVVLACLVRHREPSPIEGASIYPACQNLLLAARAVGLGGVMTQWQALCEDELRSILSIPAEIGLSATIALGRPAGRHGPVRRRPLGEVVFEDGWGRTPGWALDPPGTRFTAAGPPPATGAGPIPSAGPGAAAHGPGAPDHR